VQIGGGKKRLRRKLDRTLLTEKSSTASNRQLDVEDFGGPGWECLSIAQATTGRYKGRSN